MNAAKKIQIRNEQIWNKIRHLFRVGDDFTPTMVGASVSELAYLVDVGVLEITKINLRGVTIYRRIA